MSSFPFVSDVMPGYYSVSFKRLADVLVVMQKSKGKLC